MMAFSNVKPGDILFVKSYGSATWGRATRRVPYIAWKVERLTAKQIIAKNSSGHEGRFWIKDGRKVGDSFLYTAFIPTHEQIEEWKQTKKARDAQVRVRNVVDKMSVSSESDAFWIEIDEAITKFESKEKA